MFSSCEGLDVLDSANRERVLTFVEALQPRHPLWSYRVFESSTEGALGRFDFCTPTLAFGLRVAGWPVRASAIVSAHPYCARCVSRDDLEGGTYFFSPQRCAHCVNVVRAPGRYPQLVLGGHDRRKLEGRETLPPHTAQFVSALTLTREELEQDLLASGLEPLAAVLETDALMDASLAMLTTLFVRPATSTW